MSIRSQWMRTTLIFAISAISMAGTAVTLDQEVQATLCSHPLILAAIEQEQSTRHAVSVARGAYYPQVSIAAGGGRERSSNPAVRALGEPSISLTRGELSANLRQIIFDGGEAFGRVDQRKYENASSRFELASIRQKVILSTCEAYMNMIRQRRLVRISKDNVTAHEVTLRKVSARVSGGAGRRVERLLGMSRLSKAKAQLAGVEGDLREAEANYYRVTGHSVPRYLAMPDQPLRFLPDTLRVGVQTALACNPELQSAKANFLATKFGEKVSRARMFPTVTFELSATENENLDGVEGTNRDILGMLFARYDLFRGGSDLAGWRAARAQKCRSIRIVQDAKRSASEKLRLAWVAYDATLKQIDSLKVHVEYTRGVVGDYKTQFELGHRPLFNVLDAESDLFSARTALTSAQINHAIAYYQILEATGGINLAFGQQSLPQPVAVIAHHQHQPRIPAPTF